MTGEKIEDILARAPNPEEGTVLVNPSTGEVSRTREEADADFEAASQRAKVYIKAGGRLLTIQQIIGGGTGGGTGG